MELKETNVSEIIECNEIINSDILAGDYGPVYAGIAGIIVLIVVGYLAKGKMKLNISYPQGGISVDPVL